MARTGRLHAVPVQPVRPGVAHDVVDAVARRSRAAVSHRAMTPVGRRLAAGRDGVELGVGQHAAVHAAAVDLAVVAQLVERAAHLGLHQRAERSGTAARRPSGFTPQLLPHARGVVERRHPAEAAVVRVDDRLLADRGVAGARVVRRRHEVPGVVQQRHLGGDRVGLAAVADPELEVARRC